MATETAPTAEADKPPFVSSQGMLLLNETDNPREFLAAEYFRAGRLAAEESRGRDQRAKRDPWTKVNRLHVAWDRVRGSDGEPLSLRRTVFVTDAGIGKTTNLRWVCQLLCGEESDKLAFRLPIAELVPAGAVDLQWDSDEVVRRKLLSLFRQGLGASEKSLTPIADSLIDRQLAEGRIVLLLDALDQMPVNSPALPALEYLLGHPNWQACRIILAARPYALERHWDKLFANKDRGWRFIRLEEFNEDQQRLYLGRAAAASRDRFDMIRSVIDQEAECILTVPRVLETVRLLPVNDLKKLRTSSDVYWRAICHLTHKGLTDSKARMLGTPVGSTEPRGERDATDVALMLLSALAFEMVAMKVPLPKDKVRAVRGREWETQRVAAGQHVPNFDRVGTDDYETYRETVFKRLEEPHYRNDFPRFCEDLSRLEAMNTFLSHGLLDVGELNQMQFRNRSLQEFLAALWIARHCTDDDARKLQDWLYYPDDPVSDEYYWVWRFATEMPEQGRRAVHWVRGMQPLYKAGDGTSEGTVRSTEMIYRSWEKMEVYAKPVRDFAQLARIQPIRRQPFSSTGKKRDSEIAAEMACAAITAFQAEFQLLLDKANSVAQGITVQFEPIPAGVFEMGSPESEADRNSNERQHWVRITQGFQMHRYQVTNAAYELFDPAHAAKRDAKSKENEQPVIYVSWYDAWCFAKWVCWEGKCCALPSEAQWEYACRAGTSTPFHFGPISDGTQSNINGQYPYGTQRAGPYLATTRRVGSYPPNTIGLYDMHGNVWEWCEDWYAAYQDDPEPHDDPRGPKSGTARVLRGGSWDVSARLSRAAVRSRLSPDWHYHSDGFRLSRTP